MAKFILDILNRATKKGTQQANHRLLEEVDAKSINETALSATVFTQVQQRSANANFRQIVFYTVALLLLYVLMLCSLVSLAAPLWILILQTGTVIGLFTEAKGLGNVSRRIQNRNWLISIAVAAIGVIAMSWVYAIATGISLGQLSGSEPVNRMVVLVGFALSCGLGIGLSAIIQIITVGTYLVPPRTMRSRASYIDQSSQFDAVIDQANLQLWFMVWNTTRGLSLALLIAFGSLKGGVGVALAVIWMVTLIKMISLVVNRYKAYSILSKYG